MTNLHPRSTPTPDCEAAPPIHGIGGGQADSLGAALRAGQREAIADALAVGHVGPAPLVPAEPISNIKSEIPLGPALKSKTLFVIGLSLLLAPWLLCASALSAASFSSLPSVEKNSAFRAPHSAFDSAFSLQPSAFLSELPAPSPHALGSWLLSAAGALSILALAKQFMRKTPLEAEFLTKREFQEFKDKDVADLRNRIDHSHESLSIKLDSINNRLSDVSSLVARLDERTKHRQPPSNQNQA